MLKISIFYSFHNREWRIFIMQTIGQRIKKIRCENRQKQSDLAELLNVTQQVISNIECDKTTPDIEQLKKIADLYHMSLDQLVGRDFFEEHSDDVEQKILNFLKQMDDEGKELSLGLLSQVVNYLGKNENNE